MCDKKEFKVTVQVNTEYSTIVEASDEEEAKQIALDRDGPMEPCYLEQAKYEEWTWEPPLEFPNLGKNDEPDIEEL